MVARMKGDTEMIKQLSGTESFRRGLTETVIALKDI